MSLIVVSGLPRSGTSLLMQMLAAGGVPICTDGRRTADESNPRGYYEHETVKSLARDNEWLQKEKGQAIKIVVPLVNHLPDGLACHVLMMRRAIDEVMASQATMVSQSSGTGAKLPPERLQVVLQQLYDAALAKLRARPETSILEIEYQHLLNDAVVSADAIRKFLGRDLDVAAMAGVVDPQLYRSRGGTK